jgi:preprotein translocase subunit SecF
VDFLKKDTTFNFLGYQKPALILSTVLLLIGILSIIFRGLNFGIDFTGGTLVELSYKETVQIQDVRESLEDNNVQDAVVQYFGTSKDIMIRLPVSVEGSSAALSDKLTEILREKIPETVTEGTTATKAQQCVSATHTTPQDCHVQIKRVEFVGPQVGDELTEQGGLAMVYALIGILLYVGWRFEWRFALGSVVALVHDVLFTLGIFSIFQVEFSLPVLAAVLAIIGYSLNDTIVVFDRIRENFRKMRKSDSFTIMNTSLNQTLRRTVLTSVTTMVVVMTLLIVGGDLIRGFSFALCIGVLVGTYSSIFVASPVVLLLGISREDMLPPAKEGANADLTP